MINRDQFFWLPWDRRTHCCRFLGHLLNKTNSMTLSNIIFNFGSLWVQRDEGTEAFIFECTNILHFQQKLEFKIIEWKLLWGMNTSFFVFKSIQLHPWMNTCRPGTCTWDLYLGLVDLGVPKNRATCRPSYFPSVFILNVTSAGRESQEVNFHGFSVLVLNG